MNKISDYIMLGFLLGGLTSMLHEIICSLTNYLNNKTWKTKDYEKIIDKYIFTINYDKDIEEYTTIYIPIIEEDLAIIIEAKNNNQKRNKRKQ